MGFDKRYKLIKCPKCQENIDVSLHNYVQRLIVQNKTKTESNKDLLEKLQKVRLEKNGTIQSLHKQIKLLLNLMTKEQIEKAKKINQSIKEEIKHVLD